MRAAPITILLEIEGFQREVEATALYRFNKPECGRFERGSGVPIEPSEQASTELVKLNVEGANILPLLDRKQVIAIQDTLTDLSMEEMGVAA